MKTFAKTFVLVWFLVFAIAEAWAIEISLFEWGFNIDGNISEGIQAPASGQLPTNMDASLFNWATGLGTISVTLNSPGSHNIMAFFDHELSQSANTFFNEYGQTFNSPSSGQSWEIE
ncbi:MAG: hypothetical protein AB2L11_11250 [Syntrophobacteraceae bacterium]